MKNEYLDKAAKMPELAHYPNKELPYDVMKSDVAAWLIEQPEAREWLCAAARSYGAIVYDADANKWRGTGKNFTEPFTEKEILAGIGDRQMRVLDILAECSIQTGKPAEGQRGFAMILRKLARSGVLEFDEKLRTYRAFTRPSDAAGRSGVSQKA